MIVNINTVLALGWNTIAVIVAGGLVAAWLGWRMWLKVEGLVSRFQSWQDLAFWAVKLVVVVAILFRVGAWIFNSVNSAVVAAVNSPSVQQTGQALVGLGAAADSLIGWDGSASSTGGMLASDLQIGGAVNLLSSIAPAVEAVVDVVEMPSTTGSTFVAPDGSVQTVSPPDPSAVQLLPQPAAVQPAAVPMQGPAQAQSVVVMPGDSLAAIAKRVYGNADLWPVLCASNPALKASGCNNIAVGASLTVPPRDYASTVQPANVIPGFNNTATNTKRATAANAPAYGPVQRQYVQPTATPHVLKASDGGAWVRNQWGLVEVVVNNK